MTVGTAFAMALLMVAASIPLTMLYARTEQNKLILDLPRKLENIGALEEIQKTVDEQFYHNPAGEKVNVGMVRGYIAGLGDPWSRYLNEEEYKAYMDRIEGRTPELGIVLKYSPEVVGLVIDQVKAGSPAAASGLKSGDHITKAESGGVELSAIQAEIAPDKAADAIGKFYAQTAVTADTASIAVAITYKRDGAYRPPVNVMLGSAVSSVSYEMKGSWAREGELSIPNVGYIKIYHFFKNTADQLEEAIKDLSGRNALSYILDVRGCSEGNLESVRKAIDLFAYASRDTGSIATLQYKDGTTAQYDSTANNRIMSYTTGGFVAVLIDRTTSGVAELFAYDLRAYNPDNVFLVGSPTRGVRTVQEPFPLPTVGGAALLTVGTVTPYGVEAGKPWSVRPNEDLPATETKEAVLYNIAAPDQQLGGAIIILTKSREKNPDL